MAAGDILHVVGSLTPSRHALKFIATADEAFCIDATAVAREAAADTEGTFTAWVNIPDITGDYGIISLGDTAAIEFITMRIIAGKLSGECNAATAIQWEYDSTNVVITPHKWHHIAMVQDTSTHPPRFYVDGVEVAMTMADETNNASWIAACGNIDDGSIGAAEEAGAAGQIRECKGGISDVKIWNKALTAEQVEKDYRGQAPASITGTTADLTDWWKMKDLVNEISAARNGVKGASIQYCTGYSEFTSMMAFLGQLVADDMSISVNEKEGHIVITKAA